MVGKWAAVMGVQLVVSLVARVASVMVDPSGCNAVGMMAERLAACKAAVMVDKSVEQTVVRKVDTMVVA